MCLQPGSYTCSRVQRNHAYWYSVAVVSYLSGNSRTVELIDDINWPTTGFFINPNQILTNERLTQNNHAAKKRYGGDGTRPCDYRDS